MDLYFKKKKIEEEEKKKIHVFIVDTYFGNLNHSSKDHFGRKQERPPLIIVNDNEEYKVEKKSWILKKEKKKKTLWNNPISYQMEKAIHYLKHLGKLKQI